MSIDALLDLLRTKERALEYLADTYKIKTRRHNTYPNLVILNYDQLESPTNNPIVRVCRSLILDEADYWQPISFPFSRFPNYGEFGSDVFDWSTARVYEKLDGSLVHIYYYDGEWWSSTRGVPDAETPVHSHDISFRKLIGRIWYECGMKMPSEEHEGFCFTFELVSEYNRVIAAPKRDRGHLYLLAVRDMSTLQEHPPDSYAERYRWQCVPSHSLTTVEEIVEASRAINPMESEGYVLVDVNFNRLKVKSPQYVALAHMEDGFGERRMLTLCLANEGSEFLTYFPKHTDLYNYVNAKVRSLVIELEELWENAKDIENQKEFALKVKECRVPGALFTRRKYIKQGMDKSFLRILQEDTSPSSLEKLLL